jgi:UDP-N-acetylmuramate--alanine ligase
MARLRPRRADERDSDPGAIPARVHLVGAGGIHMSAIGELLLARGHTVSGSDLADSPLTRRLRELGATIDAGHAAEQLGDAELVVTTAAAGSANPELEAARERGLPVLLRAEMVARLVADRELLAVAGSHGKTTTSTLLALMLVRGGLDPLVLLGGQSRDLAALAALAPSSTSASGVEPPAQGTALRDGDGPHAVLEADEYAAAFLHYAPRVAIVTSIEADHLDYYGSEERLGEAFTGFAERVVEDGTLLVCADQPGAAALGAAREAAGARVERYAIDAEAGWRATQLRGNRSGGLDFIVQWDGTELGRVSLQVPGRHNVLNALAALAAAMRAGVDFHRAAAAAGEFTGAHRRFEEHGDVALAGGAITLLDDYAHHPTEVRATLAAARQRYPGRPLIGCFQPHTYSRSAYLLEGFRDCFEGLTRLYLIPTYAAREPASAGLDARALAGEITRPETIYLDDVAEAAERIAAELQPGDVFVTMGAGDVDGLLPLVRTRLEARGDEEGAP